MIDHVSNEYALSCMRVKQRQRYMDNDTKHDDLAIVGLLLTGPIRPTAELVP